MVYEKFYIRLRLKDNYEYVTAIEDITSILVPVSEMLKPDKSSVGYFNVGVMNLSFRIFDTNFHDYNKESDFVMVVSYNPKFKNANSIITLVSKLLELNVIHNKKQME